MSQPPTTIEGTHVRTLAISRKDYNRGLAISPNGTRLVISNGYEQEIQVYRLPGCTLEQKISKSSGHFKAPQKICFSPRNNSSILIAEYENKHVQVC